MIITTDVQSRIRETLLMGEMLERSRQRVDDEERDFG